jgi:hypothetical protein
MKYDTGSAKPYVPNPKPESVEKIVKTYSWDTTPSTRVVNWGDVADHHNESLTQAVEEAIRICTRVGAKE